MKPDKRERLNRSDRRDKPDGSGPDPCGSEGCDYWFLAVAACQNETFFQNNSEKGYGKSRDLRGYGQSLILENRAFQKFRMPTSNERG